MISLPPKLRERNKALLIIFLLLSLLLYAVSFVRFGGRVPL